MVHSLGIFKVSQFKFNVKNKERSSLVVQSSFVCRVCFVPECFARRAVSAAAPNQYLAKLKLIGIFFRFSLMNASRECFIFTASLAKPGLFALTPFL